MTDPARLKNRLRSSFSSSSQPSLKGMTSPTPSTQTQVQLDVLDKVLTEIEQAGVLAQVIPQVTLQATDTLNPVSSATALKESEASIVPDIGPVESGAGLQQVEYEPAPELPVEVESFLEKVEDRQEEMPDEIVIADGSTSLSMAHQPVKKPVIVLPITPEIEAAGQKKSPHWSIRWLTEWSRKIIKMFSGKVVYRQQQPETS
jgi:hypothetical protein